MWPRKPAQEGTELWKQAGRLSNTAPRLTGRSLKTSEGHEGPAPEHYHRAVTDRNLTCSLLNYTAAQGSQTLETAHKLLHAPGFGSPL